MAVVFHNSGTTSESYLKWRNFVHEFLLSRFPNCPSTWKSIALAVDILLFFLGVFIFCWSLWWQIQYTSTITSATMCINSIIMYLMALRSRQILRGWSNQEEWNWQIKWHVRFGKIFRDFWWENSKTDVTWNTKTHRDE